MIKGISKVVLVCSFWLGIASFAHAGPKKPVQPKPRKGQVISIMAYNVENLFDTKHDEGKEDYEFLPLTSKQDPDAQAHCTSQACKTTDWTEAVLSRKMARLANVVFQAGGVGPDILMLEEVENINVLQQWNTNYLKAAGYKTVVLIEGDDARGIDVGLLSRFPLAGQPILHHISFTPNPADPNWKDIKTRGILETPLLLPNGQKLTVFGLHFPSQAKTVEYRQDAIKALNDLLAQKNPQELVIAGGDFNISSIEEQTYKLFAQQIGSVWEYTQQLGCKGCLGTEVYNGQWNFFDAILFNDYITSGKGSYTVDTASIQIMNKSRFQKNPDGTPARFNDKDNSAVGVSDHFPIYVELKLNK